MNRTDRGYWIHDRVFEHAEMVHVLELLSTANMVRTKAGARHVLREPVVRALAADSRLMSIARDVLGVEPTVYRATLFDKSAAANWLVAWHQDTALPLRRRHDDREWGPWSTKGGVLHAHAPAWALERIVALRVCLDDSTAMNGPLRVLPDTHQRGVLAGEEIRRLAREVPAVDCVSGSGGVVAMRPLTVHASSKSPSDNPRRVLHIEYATALNLGTDIELAVG